MYIASSTDVLGEGWEKIRKQTDEIVSLERDANMVWKGFFPFSLYKIWD